MKLIEMAYFTDDVKQMTDFYHTLPGAEVVAQSEDMAIFMVGETKIFIHRNYPATEGELPRIITSLLLSKMWTARVRL